MPKLSKLATLATTLLLSGTALAEMRIQAGPCDEPDACIDPSGVYYDDEVLPAGNYRVGSGIVLSGGELVIAAGTSLYFDPGAGIDVDPSDPGRLVVQGTEEEPVLLTSIGGPDGPKTWTGMRLFAGIDHLIQHARIERTDTAITLDHASAEISDTQIEGVNEGIHGFDASVQLSGSTIEAPGSAIEITGVLPNPALSVLRNVLSGDGPSRPRDTSRGVLVTRSPDNGDNAGVIAGNTIRGFGAGIEVQGLSMSIEGNTVESNLSGILSGPYVQNLQFPEFTLFYGSPQFRNNIVTANDYVGIASEGSALLIEGNLVMRNRTGLEIYGGSPQILGNTVSENTQIGVTLDVERANGSETLPVPRPEPHPVMTGNTLIGNDLASSMPTDLTVRVPAMFGRVDARNNYWGIENPARIRARIYDGRDPLNSFYAVAEICPYTGHDGTPVPCRE